VKPPPFDFFAPTSLREAAEILDRYGGEAKVLAGGQSLLPLLNMRLARPAALVDINRISELDYIRPEDKTVAIGAVARHRTVERSADVQRLQPLLAEAVRFIAHPQIRNRGTVCGSIAHADPAAELPAVCVALGAQMTAVSKGGQRTINASDFFLTYLTTALEPDEILAEVRFPVLPPRTGWGFREVSRRHGDFALAGAVATLTLDPGGKCSDVRLVIFGAGPTPIRAAQAEALLKGKEPGADVIAAAAEQAGKEIAEPISDIHASADFRRHLAMTMAGRALADAARRATGQASRG
jgi:CO/xanthine dehydrogenase FAD-binding subunit